MLTEDDLNRIDKHLPEGRRKTLLKKLRKYPDDGGVNEAVQWLQDRLTKYADKLRQSGRSDLRARVDALDGEINDLNNARRQLKKKTWRSIEEPFQPSKDYVDTESN